MVQNQRPRFTGFLPAFLMASAMVLSAWITPGFGQEAETQPPTAAEEVAEAVKAAEEAVATTEQAEEAMPAEEAASETPAETTTEEAEEEPCLLYTSPSPRDLSTSRMPSSA